jgi:hypothetical protein
MIHDRKCLPFQFEPLQGRFTPYYRSNQFERHLALHGRMLLGKPHCAHSTLA